jgi:hypothetical protein
MNRKIAAILIVSVFFVGLLFFPAQRATSHDDVLRAVQNESSSFPVCSIVPPSAGPGCWYNNQQYPEGSVICVNHQLLECVGGGWQNRGSC